MKKFILTLFAVFAASIFSAFSQNKDYSEESMLVDAVGKYNNQEYAEAHRILARILKDDPDNDAAHYYMGLVRFVLGNVSGAESSFHQAVRLDPDNFWYRYRLATLYDYTGRSELTLSINEQLIKDFPKKSQLYYELINQYINTKDYDKALETLDNIDMVFGENENNAYTRFSLLGMKGDNEAAVDYLKEYSRSHSSPRILTTLGDYYLSGYLADTAIVMYGRALEIDPHYAPAISGMATSYRLNGDYDSFFGAASDFLTDPYIPSQYKGQYISEVFSPSDVRFGNMFRGRIDSLVENAVSSNPCDTVVNVAAGYYYYQTERKDKAVSLFEEVLKTYPSSKFVISNYVSILRDMGRWDDCYSYLKRLLELSPDDMNAWETFAVNCVLMKRYDEAVPVLQRIISRSKDRYQILTSASLLGDILHELGRDKDAYGYYDMALQIDPECAPVLNNYAYYLSLEGKKLKKASEMAKKCVDSSPDNPTYIDTYAWILYLQGNLQEAKDLFKHAMLYGGRDSAVILDHYAHVLYDLGEYDMAILYWQQAESRNAKIEDQSQKVDGISEKIKAAQKARNKGK